MNKTMIVGARIWDAERRRAVRWRCARRRQPGTRRVAGAGSVVAGRLPGDRCQGHVPDARHGGRPRASVVRIGHLDRRPDHAAAGGTHAAHGAGGKGAARPGFTSAYGAVRGEAAARTSPCAMKSTPAGSPARASAPDPWRSRSPAAWAMRAGCTTRGTPRRSSSMVPRRCARQCACAAARAATTSSSMCRAIRSIRPPRRTRRPCHSRKSAWPWRRRTALARLVNAHARSIGSIQSCVRAGVDVLYHCEYYRRENARHARGGQGPHFRGADHQPVPHHAARGFALGYARDRAGHGDRQAHRRIAARRIPNCASAASAMSSAAITASPGARTAPMRAIWVSSSSTMATHPRKPCVARRAMAARS